MWYSNDMFRYLFKAKLVKLVMLKVPSGDAQDAFRERGEEP